MIVTDELVYIHLPKTGGTFVEAALERLYADRAGMFLDTSSSKGRLELGVTNQHQKVSDVPAACLDRPIAFTVRNPFDHYVSFYEFGWWRRTHPPDTFDEHRIRARHPHYPDLTFDEYVKANLDWSLLDRRYVPEILAERFGATGIGLLTYDYVRFLARRPESALADPKAFLTRGVERHDGLDIRFLRQERLNRDLYELLLSAGHSPQAAGFILEMDRIHPAGGPRRTSTDWAGYYTPELRALVRERESALFDLFPEYA